MGHDRYLFTPERLLSVGRSDPDQWLRATAAEWLLPVADLQQLRQIVATNCVEARLEPDPPAAAATGQLLCRQVNAPEDV